MLQRLRERWFAQRDGLLASRSFQRWAARFFLTRPIAQRDERELFNLIAGFVFSQVLVACVRLRWFTLLADGPVDIGVLAQSAGLEEGSAARLADAAVSLRLMQRAGSREFRLGRLGAVVAGNAGLAALVEHHSALYRDLADPVALLKGQRHATALADYWAYGHASQPAGLNRATVSSYSEVMSASQSLIADEVLESYRFNEHHCLLDIGGGDGTFALRAARDAPHLQLMLFDLPAVADLARQRFDQAGLDRAQVFGGDFRHDPLPVGADLITLVRVLHDHSDESVNTILRAVHRALPHGGTLLIAEPMAGTAGGESVDAYFNFYLLAMGEGRLRTPDELAGMLRTQGFGSVIEIPSAAPQHVRVLRACR